MKTNTLLKQIRQEHASAFTHSGKFHADDVFSAALLLYLNPEITITRGNKVPEDFEGIVFDIGRGQYDHHQKDSRIRENGVAYAALGLLWEALGAEILGEELAQKFDEAFVQPLDNNDNTGEKNELAALIGNFNPTWDASGSNDEAFFQAVSVAGMILENKFERYLGNERADRRVEEILEAHERALQSGEKTENEAKILILPEKEYSLNYKCSFPSEWLGLENEELQKETGLVSAGFCHKGGFLLTTGTLEDAVKACEISLAEYREEPVLVNFGGGAAADKLLGKLPGLQTARIIHMDYAELPELELQGIYGEVVMEKQEWKAFVKTQVKQILKYKPEAVYVADHMFAGYPVVHALRKKHIPVLTMVEKDGQKLLVKIPSGS